MCKNATKRLLGKCFLTGRCRRTQSTNNKEPVPFNLVTFILRPSILRPKSWLLGKDPDAGKDWGQEEKGATEDEMVGWHHELNGHESEQTPGDGEGQGSQACCNPWGHKESYMTEWLNSNNPKAKVPGVALGGWVGDAQRRRGPWEEGQRSGTVWPRRVCSLRAIN